MVWCLESGLHSVCGFGWRCLIGPCCSPCYCPTAVFSCGEPRPWRWRLADMWRDENSWSKRKQKYSKLHKLDLVSKFDSTCIRQVYDSAYTYVQCQFYLLSICFLQNFCAFVDWQTRGCSCRAQCLLRSWKAKRQS